MFIAYNLKRIWNIIRKTNTPRVQAHRSLIRLFTAILTSFEEPYKQNSKYRILAHV
ncbi:hypothetical protein BN863_31060 [Formosa agariphila KMM 3901]|uniref:Uncharacterized protein n=1 Tax=Formosa agariphila (strain DSM 15362 / KCTC 12365 / LMG 23005 / KMM 3901 / M-2Alg 35-1) TaxID=1347342 RepID=T2KQQ2_FORAG|nr:hypothetical protein BN863_31060 [Formosa agariphila KMM 3901]